MKSLFLFADDAADLFTTKKECSLCRDYIKSTTKHLNFLSKFPLLESLTINQGCQSGWDRDDMLEFSNNTEFSQHNGLCKCRLRHILEVAAGLTKLKQLVLHYVSINSIFQLYNEAEDFIPNELVTELTLGLCGDSTTEQELIGVLKMISRFFPKLMKVHVVTKWLFMIDELNQASYEVIDMLQILKELKITTRSKVDDHLRDHLTQTFPNCNLEINESNESNELSRRRMQTYNVCMCN